MPIIVGQYRKAMTSGTIAAGLTAASIVYGFRWAPTAGGATRCDVRRITINMGDLVGFTAGFVNIQAFAVRDYTKLEDTGGTAGTFTNSNAKLDSRYPVSQGATCYITTTAATSGGVGTADTDPFATLSQSVTNTAGSPVGTGLDLFYALADEGPLTLRNTEGFIIKATVPATGTWQLGVNVTWDELV